MSILIKGMEMPDSCFHCKLAEVCKHYKAEHYANKRHEDCPLEEVPSAQPDSKELSFTHKALDTVSRQAVIEAINKIFPADPMRDDYTQGITCGAALANIYVAQLPSAEPEKRTEKHTETYGVCLDTISRKAAIDAIKGLPTWWADEGGYYGGAQPPMKALLDPTDAVSAIENLPSAQPERPKGQWTYICNSDVNGLKIVECSKCHKRAYGSGNYCHNCGAEMVKGWE